MKKLPKNKDLVGPVRGILAFRFLSDAEAMDLIEVSEILEVEEGESLVTEGETSSHFFGIIEGTLGVSVGEAEGKQVYVSSLGQGDIFGEAGIFTQVKRTATITAQAGSRVLRIHRDQLAAFLTRHPVAGNKILLVIIYGLLRKLKATNQELAYERKADMSQDDVDAMVSSMFGPPA
jgi:CRP/FNR family cyclic AMP-dependent transcriptional regulator